MLAKVTSVDVFKGHIALSIRQAADDPTLQTLDSLTSKVETTTDAGGLERVPVPVQQLLIRLSSVKDVRSIKVEQVVDGPAQSQTLQVWLGMRSLTRGRQHCQLEAIALLFVLVAASLW